MVVMLCIQMMGNISMIIVPVLQMPVGVLLRTMFLLLAMVDRYITTTARSSKRWSRGRQKIYIPFGEQVIMMFGLGVLAKQPVNQFCYIIMGLTGRKLI